MKDRWLAMIGITVLVLTPLSSAMATNFSGASSQTGCSGGSPVNMADNAAHYFWYDSLASDVQSAQNYTRSNVYDPTDINTLDDTSENSTTDAIIRDQDYTDYCGYTWHGSGGSTIGLTTCNTLNGAAECESHVIRYDNSYFNVTTTANKRGLACHETGHSLGLTHRDTDSKCMQASGPYPISLSTHDINHLNSNY